MEARYSDVRARWRPVGRYLSARIGQLHPAYFAMSMATGIVSVASSLLGLRDLAELLLAINLLMYSGLWVAVVARAAFFRDAFLADCSSHPRGPGFFTSVAATSMLGAQILTLRDAPVVGLGLWILGLLLWATCTYGIFVSISIRREKPSLADGINGGWLLAVVATQSICVLGCRALLDQVANRDAALFFLTSFWLCGGMLYIWMISLIFYRYTFFAFSPSDLMPPYWINMGAAAISTLAGTALVGASGDSALMAALTPFVKGFTLFYWATATWWIPMLIVLGIWRHVVRRVAFTYDPLYWGLVFPLGMYCVCTYRLVEMFDLPFLLWVSRAFVVVAIIAWMLCFFGFLTQVLSFALLAWRALWRPPTVDHLPLAAVTRPSANPPSPGGPP